MQCVFSHQGDCSDIQEGSEHHMSHMWLFLLGQLLHGAGASPLYTLGVTFIDENVSKKMSSVYLGEFNSRFKNTGQHCTYPDWLLYQHGEISGPRANSGPRHLAAMPAKLFASLLLFTISTFIFLIAKDLKIL
jgi:hypothetical protein